MRTAGIICECNPLHGGHLRLLNAAKEAGADAVIAVMSGCFVQRGDVAVADPVARAEILVRCGFDAVLELPFPYAAASAEVFGRAGVDILSRLGVNQLWFGSECGNIHALQGAAEIAESAEFQAAYQALDAHSHTGTAKGYFELLSSYAEEKGLSLASNDILALSYLRAIRALRSPMVPHTVCREGASYREENLTDTPFPSATALRHAWKEMGMKSIHDRLPPECRQILMREAEAGCAPTDFARLGPAILASLRTTPKKTLEEICELGGGLGARLADLAQKAASIEELLLRAATKKYTDARIRRGLLFALCGITWEDLRRPISYARLLAANHTGCHYLGSAQRDPTLPVITRYAELKKIPNAEAQLAAEERAWSLFALTLPKPRAPYDMRKRSGLILGAL